MSDDIDAYVAISELIATRLNDIGIEKFKIHLVKSAVDTSAFAKLTKSSCRKWLLDQYSLEDEQDFILIGNASALTKQKGYETFLQAFAQIAKNHANTFGFIAGTGPLLEELKLSAKQLGLENRLFFLGHIQKVREFLRALDIFLFPSNNEGLGTVMLDAQLAECCVVASRVEGF